jgi:hypothetical protein
VAGIFSVKAVVVTAASTISTFVHTQYSETGIHSYCALDI